MYKRQEPDVIIGDFDTYKSRLPENCEIIRHPEEKDDTDTMLAVKLALNRGFKHIVICGCLLYTSGIGAGSASCAHTFDSYAGKNRA